MGLLSYFYSSLCRDVSGGGPISPSTFTSGHNYFASRDMWVYEPPGYADNSNNYPLILFFHGIGVRGTNINDLITEGLPKFLDGGDEPPGILIASPQLDSGDWQETDIDNALSYMTTNYRVNTNRVTMTGLSAGAWICRKALMLRASDIAGTVWVAAPSYTVTWSASTITELAIMAVHGTNDGTVSNDLQTIANSALPYQRKLPLHMINIWNGGHNNGVWDDYCYDRKERTDAAGVAPFDYVRYLKKQSKDETERATLFVESAEETEDIFEYREAKQVVRYLATGTTRTNLESRLATVKANIDAANGRRFILDFGAASPSGSTGQASALVATYNTVTTATAGSTKTNLVDDNNSGSTYGWAVVTQHATAPTSRLNEVGTRTNGRFWGYDMGVTRDGMRIEGSVTGTSKFTSLNNSKTYTLRFFPNQGGSNTTRSRISIKIGSTTKSQDAELNTVQYVEFTGLSPSSGEISFQAWPSGTGSPPRNVQLAVIELIEEA